MTFTKAQYKACVKAFFKGGDYLANKYNSNKVLGVHTEAKSHYSTLYYVDSKRNKQIISQNFTKGNTPWNQLVNSSIYYNSTYTLDPEYILLLNEFLHAINPKVSFVDSGGKLVIVRLYANLGYPEPVPVPQGTNDLLRIVRLVIPDFFA